MLWPIGWLEKKGSGVMSGKKKRYFVADNKELSYYDSDKKEKRKLLGVVPFDTENFGETDTFSCIALGVFVACRCDRSHPRTRATLRRKRQ